MISYKLPIKCTPQLVIVPASYTVVDVTEPVKCGSLYLPHLHITASQLTQPVGDAETSDTAPDNGWVNMTIHCVERSGEPSGNRPETYEFDYSRSEFRHHRNTLGSLVHHCNAPVVTQESFMSLSGSFTHYYNKRTYLVFAETLNNSAQSFGIPTGSRTGSTNYSRAVSEGSLTRTIT